MTAAGFRLPGGESTSARLRHVEQERDDAKTAFAASQADLTHVERQLADAESDRMKAERERDEALHELAHARFARDMATTRLAHALELLRTQTNSTEGAPMTSTDPGGEGGNLTGGTDD